jgi:hypothetical protein
MSKFLISRNKKRLLLIFGEFKEISDIKKAVKIDKTYWDF